MPRQAEDIASNPETMLATQGVISTPQALASDCGHDDGHSDGIVNTHSFLSRPSLSDTRGRRTNKTKNACGAGASGNIQDTSENTYYLAVVVVVVVVVEL